MTPTQRAAMEQAIAALEGIQRYGLDTLSGRTDGPDDRAWQRAGVNEMTKRARLGIAPLRAALAEPAPVQEPVAYHTDGVMREVFAQCLTSTYVCSRVWAAWGVGTMSEDDFSPASECDELLDELVQAHKTINALDAKLAQP